MPATTAYDWAIDHTDTTTAFAVVRTALATFQAFAAAHLLSTFRVEVCATLGTSQRWDHETEEMRDCLPEITLAMLPTGEFLRWAEALDPPELIVERRDVDFIVRTPRLARDGFDWLASTSVHRFDGRMGGSGVDWDHSGGRITDRGGVPVAGFRRWLAGHNYRFADGTPVEG